jgi:hypothetical protein
MRKRRVTELIALGMVTTVRMIESEMGYRAAKPCLNPETLPEMD